jgi:hypothetical protein
VVKVDKSGTRKIDSRIELLILAGSGIEKVFRDLFRTLEKTADDSASPKAPPRARRKFRALMTTARSRFKE